MNNTAKAILKYRWLIIIIVLALTAFLGYQIKNITINSDVVSSLPDDDPDAALFKKIGSQFGGNNMGMIILESENLFTTSVLKHIQQITDTVRETEGIATVTSLTNIIDIKGDEFGLEIGKLINEYDFPETDEELQRIKKRVFEKDMYKGSIVSEDGTSALIIFTLTEDAVIKEVANEVKEKIEDLDLPEDIYYGGSPMMVTDIAELISSDLIKLIPITFILIALILFISFRTVRGVVLPLLTAAIAIVWAIGLMALFGYNMSMISNNIPIILLAVGSAYTIHVLNRINQEQDLNRKKALIKAIVYIFIPVVLAALTTAIGFTSFIFGAYLEMIRDFGIFTALGTIFSALLALFFVPAIIASFSIYSKKAKTENNQRYSLLTKRFLEPLKHLLFTHPKYILSTWGILIIISIGGIFLIERSVNIQEYFKKDNPTRIAEDILIEKFGGSKPIFVLFKGNVQSPEVLQTMMRTEEYMKNSPDVYTTQSVADLIAEIMDVMGEGRGIPDEADKIEQLWFLLDGNEMMSRFVSDDLDEGIIISKFTSPDNKSKKEFARYMKKFIEENSTEDCRIEITGMPFIDITMDRSLVNSQFGSLTIAVIFVIIIVGLILRSLMSGIYATLPIIATITLLFGFMGYTGISLNLGTVLVASVALGIGIDYSIHVISHFNHAIRNNNLHDALESTITVSGKAIVINILSVTAGFLVLLFSEMVPLQYFGLLIAMSMIGSGMGALTLLPVILVLTNRRKERLNTTENE